ncbi:response regulator transcription factor [Novosphingobium sp.]|uniref:response regulator transcription factor n=1 Tax=Novosphingobium sp. TaxID=1874826 RepID=UPI002FE3EA59
MSHAPRQSMHAPGDAGVREGTILIVDSEGEARLQLMAVMSDAGYAIRTFSRAGELLHAPLPNAPCCVVAEAGPPSGAAIDLIEGLRRRGQPIPVVFLSDNSDVSQCVRAIKAGAVDFLLRPLDKQHLLGAVALALELDRKRRPIAHREWALVKRFDSLTPRERQVMGGVVRGLMNKQIAWELDISEVTVKLHRSSMMRKMDMRTVPDLVRASDILPAEQGHTWAA